MKSFVRDMKVSHLLDIINSLYTDKGKIEKLEWLSEMLEEGEFGEYELGEYLMDCGREREAGDIVQLCEDGNSEVLGLIEYLKQEEEKREKMVSLKKVEKLKKLSNLGVM